MNCDECKEQVLDLVEREADDPEAVRKVLERCPECRALFEQMKTALQLAAELPIETPPPTLDEVVLEAARTRTGRVTPVARKRFRAMEWAAAAIALLVVGAGLWAMPRSGRVTSSDREQRQGPKELPVERAQAEVGASDEAAATGGTAAVTALSEGMSEAAAKARRKRGAPVEQEAQRAARPESGLTSEDAARAASPVADAAMLEANAPRAAATKKRADSVTLRCQKHLSKLEAKDREVSAEDALWLGHCYQEAGDPREARRWFERAAADPATRASAERALRSLPSE
jgi:hypothetical protein